MSHRLAVAGVAVVLAACADTPTQVPEARDLSPSFVVGGSKPIFVETYDLGGPPVPCDGLVRNGIEYSFRVAGAPGPDCAAGTFAGPGVTNSISAPNIEGTADGTLTLVFDVPTTEVSFGVAISSGVPDTVIVDLFRPGAGTLREEVALSVTNDPVFVGGHFAYRGPAVKTVTISFDTPPFLRFALDNVDYFRPAARFN